MPLLLFLLHFCIRRCTLTLFWFCSQKQLILSMMASINLTNSMQTTLNYKDQFVKILLLQGNVFDHFFFNFPQNKKRKSFDYLFKSFLHIFSPSQNSASPVACDSEQGTTKNCRVFCSCFIVLTATFYISAWTFSSSVSLLRTTGVWSSTG